MGKHVFIFMLLPFLAAIAETKDASSALPVNEKEIKIPSINSGGANEIKIRFIAPENFFISPKNIEIEKLKWQEANCPTV